MLLLRLVAAGSVGMPFHWSVEETQIIVARPSPVTLVVEVSPS